MTSVLASAADRRYGWWLLNLLGSVKANSDIFDRIVVFDLGLSPIQRRLAASVPGVELRGVPPFAPHWSAGFTWKPWIWTNIDAESVVYLDAGVTVLKSLGQLLDEIEGRGYFLVSQERPFGEILPADYYDLYSVPREWNSRPYVAAGIIGFRTNGAFYRDVILPTFRDCLEGRSVGFSAGEVDELNVSLQRTDEALIRDAPRFRHDQTILNIHLFKAIAHPVIGDLDQFGGSRSPRDHPDQVIWNHRRRGDFRYIARVPFRGRMRLFGRMFGVAFRARWWLRMHRWLFRPSTYTGKARRLITSRRSG